VVIGCELNSERTGVCRYELGSERTVVCGC
jgi:hypothetical protein